MKVIMKDNLIERYMKNFPYDSSLNDEKNITFLRRIEGKVINLIFTHGDAFEENDNDLWLPDNLWEKI